MRNLAGSSIGSDGEKCARRLSYTINRVVLFNSQVDSCKQDTETVRPPNLTARNRHVFGKIKEYQLDVRLARGKPARGGSPCCLTTRRP